MSKHLYLCTICIQLTHSASQNFSTPQSQKHLPLQAIELALCCYSKQYTFCTTWDFVGLPVYHYFKTPALLPVTTSHITPFNVVHTLLTQIHKPLLHLTNIFNRASHTLLYFTLLSDNSSQTLLHLPTHYTHFRLSQQITKQWLTTKFDWGQVMQYKGTKFTQFI